MTCLIDGGSARWVAYPLTVRALLGSASRMTATGRRGGEHEPSYRYGRYVGRLPYGASWDGSLRRLQRRAFKTVVDDFGAVQVVRFCPGCCRWLDRDEHFSPGTRSEAGAVIAWDRSCRVCKTARDREAYARRAGSERERENRRARYRRLMSDPVKLAARRERNRLVAARVRAADPERVREIQRRYAARVRADSEAREHRNAIMREGYRLRRHRESLPVRDAAPILRHDGETTRIDSEDFPHLPSAPLAKVVARLIASETAGLYAKGGHLQITGEDGRTRDPESWHRGGAPPVVDAVCDRLGITTKTYREWRDQKRRTTRFDTADKVISRADLLWFDVYDGDEVCSNGRTVEWVFTATDLAA